MTVRSDCQVRIWKRCDWPSVDNEKFLPGGPERAVFIFTPRNSGDTIPIESKPPKYRRIDARVSVKAMDALETDQMHRHRDSMRTHNARRADVRSIGKTAISLAMVSLCPLAPGFASAQESTGHRIAVVDVAHIFKNHAGIKAQVEKVEAELKAYEAELQAKREELKQAAEQLKSFKVGSAEYAAQEERIASMDSKLRLDMNRKRKELADAEARIYFENYKLIANGVKFLANYYKINLVLRYNSEGMDLENSDTVIRNVMKNIVYHDESLDMTKGVMQYLDETMKTADSGTGVKR